MFRKSTRLKCSLLALAVTGMCCSIPAVAEEAMTNAASKLLDAMSSQQMSVAAFSFEAEERNKWHFIPNEIFQRSGISLKQLSNSQRQLAHELLSAGLSESGYLTAMAIIELERVLKALEPDGRFARDHEDYFVSVFGTPEKQGSWGWRFEGHHLSLHFTVVAGEVTVSSPSFFGSNPAEVRSGAQSEAQQGQRVLAQREDGARALLLSLNVSQLAAAVISDAAPRDIITGNQYPIDALEPVGVKVADMTRAQVALLEEVIAGYTSAMSDDIAAARWQEIRRDGLENVVFAWSGTAERGAPHYYRVQGPSFLIEYDNVQNEANHVHSVWRDFDDDFGHDALRAHYDAVAH